MPEAATMAAKDVFHPDILPSMEAYLQMKWSRPPGAIHDLDARRRNLRAFFAMMSSRIEETPSVKMTEFETQVADGHVMKMYWFAKEGGASKPSSAVLYVYGGGYISGDAEMGQKFVKEIVNETGVPLLSLAYRIAPEHQHPTAVEDAYAGLQWLHAHAEQLGVDRSRIAVMGSSAGGGLAACVALMARDRQLEPPLKQQILGCPMLDDRNTNSADHPLDKFYVWGVADNIIGWNALLGKGVAGSDSVPDYAAPARAKNLSGLPPAYIDVGTVDLFCDEDMEYARRLLKAGVSTELHVFPGLPHIFEIINSEMPASKSVRSARCRVITSL